MINNLFDNDDQQVYWEDEQVFQIGRIELFQLNYDDEIFLLFFLFIWFKLRLEKSDFDEFILSFVEDDLIDVDEWISIEFERS